MSEEMTIKDVLKPRMKMETVAEILDSIKSAVETNDKFDDINVGVRMGLLQAYTIVSDAIILELMKEIN